MIKYVLVDDSAVNTGGTELTLSGIFESRKDSTQLISTSQLNKDLIENFKDCIFIFGNITGLFVNPALNDIINSLQSIKYVKIEFDYNFCPYRCEYAHYKFAQEQCACPYNTAPIKYTVLYETIQKTAKHIFFMSEKQRAIYSQHIPIMKWHKTSVLSSCFNLSSLAFFRANRHNQKNDKYAILDGYSTWHREAKGKDKAIEFCNLNDLKYDILPQQPYDKHILLFSTYKGIVFLPIIHDTCPRCIIEAKLLNMDVITNYNSQHTMEHWWTTTSSVDEYISSRPHYFWDIIDQL